MTQIKLIFSIFGESLNPELIGRILQVAPSAFWNKGDLVPNQKVLLLRKEACWQYSFDYIKTLDFEDIANAFFDLIIVNINSLAVYITTNKLETKLDVVVEIYNSEKPSLSVNKKLMEVMSRLNGEIDFDLYSYSNPNQ